MFMFILSPFFHDIFSDELKLSPQPIKHGTLKSPLLMACKVEMSTVELPPAMKQRNIKITDIDMKTSDNELRQRRKSKTAETMEALDSGSCTTFDEDTGITAKPFETHLVMEFSPNINRNTLHWVIDKLRKKKIQGGAGLLVRREPQQRY